MYNRVILMGRITHDLELRTTPNGIPVLTFSIAVDRRFGKGEERKSDFFRCTAWRTSAEFISRWFSKGRCILVEGELQTGSYIDKNNAEQRTVEIVVDNASFTGEKKADAPPQGGYGTGAYQPQYVAPPSAQYGAPPAQPYGEPSPAYTPAQPSRGGESAYTPAQPQSPTHPAESSNSKLAASNGTDADFASSAEDTDDGYPF